MSRVASLRAAVGRGWKALACLQALTAMQVQAQSVDATEAPAAGRSLVISPSISVGETLTNNNRLSAGGGRSEAITQITPSIHVASNRGPIRGFLDYSLNGLIYARSSENNEIQNVLNGSAQVEAIDNRAFVDLNASISQQLLSAYGTRTADSTSANNNRAEVRTYSISPNVRGYLGNVASYEARVTYGATHSAADDLSDSSYWQALVRLEGDNAARFVNWSADASRNVVDYNGGLRSTDDRLRGLLYLSADPSLRFSLIWGREANNLLTGSRQSRNTPGWGVDWLPTTRTRLSAVREQRFFGKSHALTFEHRMARSVWRYSDVRDVSTGLGQPTLGRIGSVFDLFFQQFASLQPDPALRTQLVNDFLLANNLSPTTSVFARTLASSVTLQRRRDLSFALLGVRDTLTFVGSQSEGRRLTDRLSDPTDDFANGNVVRQRGLSVQLAHRLTPLSTLNVIGSIDRTDGTTVQFFTKLRTIALAWTGQLNARTGVSLGGRHVVSDGSSDSYTETAVMATLSYRF
jgi:uncharacterized protein (PEP-CTERM system associated)